jgi:hypothetical protein
VKKTLLWPRATPNGDHASCCATAFFVTWRSRPSRIFFVDSKNWSWWQKTLLWLKEARGLNLKLVEVSMGTGGSNGFVIEVARGTDDDEMAVLRSLVLLFLISKKSVHGRGLHGATKENKMKFVSMGSCAEKRKSLRLDVLISASACL